MSQFETIARPYAKAVYTQAESSSSTTQWQNFLQILAEVIKYPVVMQRIAAPGFYGELLEWIEQYLKKTRKQPLTPEEKNFLQLLYDHDRLLVLPEIAAQFTALLNAKEGCCQVNVFTAQPLSSKQQEEIRALLAKKTGREVLLTIIEDEKLLAGVRIEYDGFVIDQSIKGRMMSFAQKLDDVRN